MQKNKAFTRWMRRRNTLNRTEYEEARNVAERVKRKAKQEAWESLEEVGRRHGRYKENDIQHSQKYKRKEESIVMKK